MKTVAWLIVVKESTNLLFFCIFEYGAEYGAGCSAQSGAKCYLIFRYHSILTFCFQAKGTFFWNL